jgi:hypothetical protein
VYRLLGAPERFAGVMTDTGHGHFEADRIHGWLGQWLRPPAK